MLDSIPPELDALLDQEVIQTGTDLGLIFDSREITVDSVKRKIYRTAQDTIEQLKVAIYTR